MQFGSGTTTGHQIDIEHVYLDGKLTERRWVHKLQPLDVPCYVRRVEMEGEPVWVSRYDVVIGVTGVMLTRAAGKPTRRTGTGWRRVTSLIPVPLPVVPLPATRGGLTNPCHTLFLPG